MLLMPLLVIRLFPNSLDHESCFESLSFKDVYYLNFTDTNIGLTANKYLQAMNSSPKIIIWTKAYLSKEQSQYNKSATVIAIRIRYTHIRPWVQTNQPGESGIWIVYGLINSKGSKVCQEWVNDIRN